MKSIIGTNRRAAALLLAFLLLLGQYHARAAQTREPVIPDEFVVGNPTAMNGDFFTGLWGNSTSDIDVRALLHGYDLVSYDGGRGNFIVNPSVVSGYAVTENEVGDRTYVLALYDDLYYSDGTHITARDYAFSFLLQLSPQLAAAGARHVRTEHLLGSDPYSKGETTKLTGVRVLSEDTLALTLDHAFLPFFYEVGLLECHPYPMHVIAPGVTVRDDGDGVYLANEDNAADETVFTAELLRRTVLDPETGYRAHPSVVSGPYTLASWDGVTARFTVNPWFKGDKEGRRPSIPNVVYTLADNDDMMEKMNRGEFNLLNKVTEARAIEQGMTLASQQKARMSAYPRTGLTFIAFACEKPSVASQAVRQAIACCMDRDEIISEYVGAFGARVDGYYGLGQWMPAAADLEGLLAYTLDTTMAAFLLDKDGWVPNADGLREKEIDGETIVLDLIMAYPEGNRIAEAFDELFVPHLEEVGIRLTLQPLPMDALLRQYYKQEARAADMIYLGSNFDIIFDPSVSFLADEWDRPNWAYTNCADEDLYALAVALRETEPDNIQEYCREWEAFQKRFNEVLPMIPIYSNTYFDFYMPSLENYNIIENVTWAEAIIPAYISEEAGK